MRTIRDTFIALAILLACCCFTQAKSNELSYPYKASAQRESQILSGASRVTPGMNRKQVKAILDEPDEITDLFRRSDIEAKPIGSSHWYIIQRKASPQSEPVDTNQKLIRVCFDLDGKVTSVDYWGIEKPKDISR